MDRKKIACGKCANNGQFALRRSNYYLYDIMHRRALPIMPQYVLGMCRILLLYSHIPFSKQTCFEMQVIEVGQILSNFNFIPYNYIFNAKRT
jgi:hypothetical protein